MYNAAAMDRGAQSIGKLWQIIYTLNYCKWLVAQPGHSPGQPTLPLSGRPVKIRKYVVTL